MSSPVFAAAASPANALGHGRPRAPFVSRLPRVPGRGRLPGRSPPSFPAAPRLDVGVHRRPRNQELPSEPVRVDLSRPDEVVRLASARPHVLLHLDHRHSFIHCGPGCPRARRIRLCEPWFLQSSRAAPREDTAVGRDWGRVICLTRKSICDKKLQATPKECQRTNPHFYG